MSESYEGVEALASSSFGFAISVEADINFANSGCYAVNYSSFSKAHSSLRPLGPTFGLSESCKETGNEID